MKRGGGLRREPDTVDSSWCREGCSLEGYDGRRLGEKSGGSLKVKQEPK